MIKISKTNPKSDMKIVNPDDSCEWGELKI